MPWNLYGTRVRIEVLYLRGCPNAPVACANVQEALRLAGLGVVVEEVEVGGDDDIRRLAMRGSPTILVDGRDPFPSSDGPSLACRLYGTTAALSGAPTVAQLVEVLSP